MGGHSSNTLPRPVAGINPQSLTMGAEERFVLACIDGATSEAAIAESTGLSAERVAVILDRLVALGAVTFEPASAAQPSRTVRSSAVSATHQLGPLPPVATPANPNFKEQVYALHRALDSATHYELLGVPDNAPPAAIRQAFHELIRVFHPDRHFGEALGELRPMLDRIATHLNRAYDVLARGETRQEYDQYLNAIGRTRQLDTVLDRDSAEATELASVERLIAQAASEPPEERPAASTIPPSGPRSRPSITFTAPDEAARRRALALKLGLSSRPPPQASAPPPPPSPASTALAAEALKARYEQRVSRERKAQVQRFVGLADTALAKGDFAGAASALRIARSLAPEQTAITERLAVLEQRAASELWEVYVERAKYEAREGRFGRAARSYERAALGNPSARWFERAAWYYLESGGDLRHAGELAHRAVSMDPENARCRLALARFYFLMHLRDSALAELERAIALAPGDATIRDWMRRIKRGGQGP